MNLRKWGRIALAVATMAGAAGTASAYEPIERSGNTYHQAVCGRAIGHAEARCFAHVKVDARGEIMSGKADNASPNVTPSGFGPADLRSAYKIVGTGSAARTIAIVDAYGYKNAEADLATYRAQYGLPACTTANGCFRKVNQSGGTAYPRDDTGWSQETALDLDMASAICPDCHILLVEGNSPSFADLAAAVDRAAVMGAQVISNSYGGSDSASSSYGSHYVHPGIAITASTGDNGYGVSFPATGPTVIAVGGTSLYRAANSRGFTESAWNGAGSGCSSYNAKPNFQTDTGCATRTVADVSAVADPNTGVAVYGPSSRSRSGWMVFGGTSASAPLIGAVYALAGANHSDASSLYANPNALFDVTSGSNGTCGGTYLCTSGTGYDGPTGLGTPNGTGAF